MSEQEKQKTKTMSVTMPQWAYDELEARCKKEFPLKPVQLVVRYVVEKLNEGEEK